MRRPAHARTLATMTLAFAVSGTVLLSACNEPTERDPLICVGKNCGFPREEGGGLPEGGRGGGGDGNEGGEAGESGGVTLTGSVLLLNDLDFRNGGPFTDSAEIRIQKSGGGAVTGAWNGSDPFRIENVLEGRAVWALGTPTLALNNDALPTLEPVRTDDPNAEGVVEADPFALVRASTMENIYDLLTVPITPDPARAQVVLRIVNGSGAGISGVRVTAESAEVTIYATSGAFSDDETQTDVTGLVVLANAPASAWPGSLLSVSFAGAETGAAELRVIAGAVTVVSVRP
jgi:hypothetical protein